MVCGLTLGHWEFQSRFWYILVQNDRVVRTPWDEIDGKFDDGKFAPTGNNRKINFFDLM